MSEYVNLTREVEVGVCIYEVKDTDGETVDFSARVDSDGDVIVTIESDNSTDKIEELEKDVDDQSDLIIDLESDVDKLKLEVERLENNIEALENTEDSLKQHIETLEADIEDLHYQASMNNE